jgi:hypothetical protein
MPGWLSVFIGFLVLVVLPLALQGFHECSVWMANRLLERAIALLPEPDRDQYRAEWQAELANVPGKLTKLARAIGLLVAAVRMRRPLRDPRQVAVRRRQDPGLLLQLSVEGRINATIAVRRPIAVVAVVVVAALTAAVGAHWYQLGSRTSGSEASGFGTSPSLEQQQLALLRNQRDALAAEIQEIGFVHDGFEGHARAECSGIAGPGLTGVAGDGPYCMRLREEVDLFRQDSRLDDKQSTLASIDYELAELEGRLATSSEPSRRVRGLGFLSHPTVAGACL